MRGIRNRNTRPEVAVRKLLHGAGFRYRLDSRIGKIRPDIVLPKWKTAVFVHGCFWHGHESCHLYRLPKSQQKFWSAKIAANLERDQRTLRALLDNEWNVVVIWECALKGRRRKSISDIERILINAISAPAQTWFEIKGADQD